MSISTEAAKCILLFKDAANHQNTIDSETLVAVDELYYRFERWADNVGAFAKGTASTDYRLRKDAQISQVLRFILERLSDNIKDIIKPPSYAEDSEDSESQESTSDEDSMDSVGSEEEECHTSSANGEETPPNPESSQHVTPNQFLKEATLMVERLYKLTAVLRKPVSSSEDSKVERFTKKHPEDPDVIAALRDHASFKIQQDWHRGTPFLVPEQLVRRLVDGIVFRRNKLRYRANHQRKLALPSLESLGLLELGKQIHNAEQPMIPPLKLNAGTVSDTQTVTARDTGRKVTFADTPQAGIGRSADNGGTTLKKHGQTILSETIASSIQREKFQNYAKSIALSRINRSTIDRLQGLDVPRPPRPERTGKNIETICPYCHKPVPKVTLDGTRWTRHVLQDIEAYQCLFPDCKTPPLLFRSSDKWLQHLQEHAVIWCCEVIGHPERQLFNSREELEEHILASHADSFTENQIPILVDSGKRTIEDPFFHLMAAYDKGEGLGSYNAQAKAEQTEPAHGCLLCPDFSESMHTSIAGDNTGSSTAKGSQIHDHILGHLEALALLSLPERDDVKESDTASLEGKDYARSSKSSLGDAGSSLRFGGLTLDDETPPNFAKNDLKRTSEDLDRTTINDGMIDQDVHLAVPDDGSIQEEERWDFLPRFANHPMPENDRFLQHLVSQGAFLPRSNPTEDSILATANPNQPSAPRDSNLPVVPVDSESTATFDEEPQPGAQSWSKIPEAYLNIVSSLDSNLEISPENLEQLRVTMRKLAASYEAAASTSCMLKEEFPKNYGILLDEYLKLGDMLRRLVVVSGLDQAAGDGEPEADVSPEVPSDQSNEPESQRDRRARQILGNVFGGVMGDGFDEMLRRIQDALNVITRALSAEHGRFNPTTFWPDDLTIHVESNETRKTFLTSFHEFSNLNQQLLILFCDTWERGKWEDLFDAAVKAEALEDGVVAWKVEILNLRSTKDASSSGQLGPGEEHRSNDG